MDKHSNYSSCTNCLHQPNPVPFIVHESAMVRMERTNKRLWVIVILLVLLLTATNAAWIYYENQFEDVVTTTEIEQDADGDGSNYIVGGDFNGEAES